MKHVKIDTSGSGDWRVLPGHSYPLGATWDGSGVNFALFSAHAERVELCLFDASGRHETARIEMPEYTHEIWHCYLPEAHPGLLYGYRVHGPYKPAEGKRFNPNKLLIDPYAKALAGPFRWTDANFGYRLGAKRADLSFDRRDNAFAVPKARVCDPAFTWDAHGGAHGGAPGIPLGDAHGSAHVRPRTPWTDTVIYEAHVKGMTQLIPNEQRGRAGTFEALSSPRVIDHLTRLGITAIELMPIHAFIDERWLHDRGMTNYWGYNSIGFFAPHPPYLGPRNRISTFKTFVKRMHEAGIEVILDVVYNHTAEGNELGATLSFRGIDNEYYYRLNPENGRYYDDVTGCGNSLDLSKPRVLQMVADSLRYWVGEMGVDGFRFDLATTLGRELYGFDPGSGFFEVLRQDPMLSRVKLIAEPWDTGPEGYRLGGYGVDWGEWNDRYRDTVRAFWRGDEGILPELASRMAGSADLFDYQGRKTWASINFLAAHDGFTLHDVVSYNDKHNEANGEGNADGHSHNLSFNHGHEGPTDDPDIDELRERQKRNMLLTLFTSLGTPMLLMGDEQGRTQGGNNNSYCQDNEINWLDWSPDENGRALFDFVRHLIRLRRTRALLRRANFPHGALDDTLKEVTWFRPDGGEMSPEDWQNPVARSLCVLHAGNGQSPILVLLNASAEDVGFTLPDNAAAARWTTLADTLSPDGLPARERASFAAGAALTLEARSALILEGSAGDHG